MNIMQSVDNIELGKEYEFSILKINKLNEIGVLQVLFGLYDEKYGKTLYYLQDYKMDVRKGSEFMNLLDWCELNYNSPVFYYDTDLVVGCCGIGMILENYCGDKKIVFTDMDVSNCCKAESF